MREIDIAFATICMCRNFPSSPRIYASYRFSENLLVCLFHWAWPHLVISRSFPGRMSTFFASRQTAGRHFVACFSPAKLYLPSPSPPFPSTHHAPHHNTKHHNGCITSTFTGSVAALKASKVQVRLAAARRRVLRRDPRSRDVFPRYSPPRSARKRAAADASSLSSSFRPSLSKVIKADIYPGTYPGGGESPIIPFGSEKNAEREVIHGRWAMLGVTGAWAAENGTGIPWFTAGTLTPDDCTAVADKFPGAVAPLAPRAPATLLLGRPRHRGRPRRPRRGVPPASPTPSSTSSPSVTSPPVATRPPRPRRVRRPRGAQDQGAQALPPLHVRVARLHHAGPRHPGGPIASWQAHVADPVHANVLTNAASGLASTKRCARLALHPWFSDIVVPGLCILKT